EYAAGDAYAGFMLYHCMNAKRVAMKPVPPLPLLADKYLPFSLPEIISIRLNPVEKGTALTAEEFFGTKHGDATNASRCAAKCDEPVTNGTNDTRETQPKQEMERLDPTSKGMLH